MTRDGLVPVFQQMTVAENQPVAPGHGFGQSEEDGSGVKQSLEGSDFHFDLQHDG